MSDHDGIDGDRPTTSKRRRILACDTCRRLKSRCEVAATKAVCKRCETLRIECSLQACIQACVPPPPMDQDSSSQDNSRFNDINKSLTEHGAILRDIKATVDLMYALQQDISAHQPTTEHRLSVTPRLSQEPDIYARVPGVVDKDMISASIRVVRRNHTPRSGVARLREPRPNALDLGIISEDQALQLLRIFRQRVQPWLQLNSPTLSPTVEVQDFARSYPLLFATACLKAGRLLDGYCNSASHEQLYEHVRQLTSHELLISPLQPESIYALLLSSSWSTGPKTKPEYIDSWLLSSYAAQQAMLKIDFATLRSNLTTGCVSTDDLFYIKLWNMLCFCHLQFALGTGKPCIIPSGYLEHCSATMNTLESTSYDRIVVVGISLLSFAEQSMRISSDLKHELVDKYMIQWKDHNAHLLHGRDYRTSCLCMTYNLCYVVLARRCLECASAQSNDVSIDPTAGVQIESPLAANPGSQESIIRTCFDQSRELLKSFRSLPLDRAEEMPEFFFIAVLYAVAVATNFAATTNNKYPVVDQLEDDLRFAQSATSKTLRTFDLTISSLLSLGNMSESQAPLESGAQTEFSDWNVPDFEQFFEGDFGNVFHFTNHHDQDNTT